MFRIPAYECTPAQVGDTADVGAYIERVWDWDWDFASQWRLGCITRPGLAGARVA